MLKDSEPAELVRAIRKVYQGEPTLAPIIASRVINEIRDSSSHPKSAEPLSMRELEVLGLVSKGLSNQEITEQLTIAEVTVRTHVSQILNKLHLTNRVQATLHALREDIASLEGK